VWTCIDNIHVVVTKRTRNVFCARYDKIFGNRVGLTATSDIIAHFVLYFIHISLLMFNDPCQITVRMLWFITSTFENVKRFVLTVNVLLSRFVCNFAGAVEMFARV
jgi:hypothetical protein